MKTKTRMNGKRNARNERGGGKNKKIMRERRNSRKGRKWDCKRKEQYSLTGTGMF